MAPENTGVSQFLNGYLQHHHLLQSFPEILPSEQLSGFNCAKLAATYITNEEQADRQVPHLYLLGYVRDFDITLVNRNKAKVRCEC